MVLNTSTPLLFLNRTCLRSGWVLVLRNYPIHLTVFIMSQAYVQAVLKAVDQGVLIPEEHITMESGYIYVNVAGEAAQYGHSLGRTGLQKPFVKVVADISKASFSRSARYGYRELHKLLHKEGFHAVKVERTVSIAFINE